MAKGLSRSSLLLVIQLVLSVAILASPLSNYVKLVLFPIVWWFTFEPRLSPRELLLFFGLNLYFVGMDVVMLRQGVFYFTRPDFLGIPAYEILLWGFMIVHSARVFRSHPVPGRVEILPLVMVGVFSVIFGAIRDFTALTLVSSGVLVGWIAVFRDRFDLPITLYMALLGVAWEYTGTLAGHWGYPSSAPTIYGVAPWFFPMFGAVGLSVRRVLFPWVYPERRTIAQSEAPA